MNFIKPYDENLPAMVNAVETNVGDSYEPIYHRRYNSDGSYKIEVVGKTNLTEKIRSSKEAVDVTKMIKRYSISGDDSFLGTAFGTYADLVGVPNNFIEAYNMFSDIRDHFESLPLDIRKKYESNIGLYLADLQAVVNAPKVDGSIHVDEPIIKKEVIVDADK